MTSNAAASEASLPAPVISAVTALSHAHLPSGCQADVNPISGTGTNGSSSTPR